MREGVKMRRKPERQLDFAGAFLPEEVASPIAGTSPSIP